MVAKSVLAVLASTLILSVVAYEEEWAEFQAAQGARNGDIPAAFKRNVDLVREHNSQNHTYSLTYVGPFADLTDEEFEARFTGDPSGASDTPILDQEVDVEAQVAATPIDWSRVSGKMNPIKNQGSCGSCWAFSAVGSLESAWAIKTGKLEKLSEQHLVDCDKGSSGCAGGDRMQGQDFLKGGACASSSYSYTGRDGSCKASSCQLAVPKGAVSGHSTCSATPDALKSALANQPMAISLHGALLKLYANGVVTTKCDHTTSHAVIAVGWGHDGQDYFKIRNSWGTSFGESGYIRLAANIGDGGACCMFMKTPSHPVVSRLGSVSV